MKRKVISIQDIQKLYYELQLSMQDTANRLGKNISQVYKFMRRHDLPRRTFAHTQKIQFLKSPLSFNLKSNLTPKERQLFISALMLYWAEGSKREASTVDFTNSDPKMVNVFLKTLISIYRVDKTRIRVLLYCYSNQDLKSLIKYWSKFLSIPQNQFTKPYVRTDFNPTEIHKMPLGLVHIRYADSRLLIKIKQDIDIIYKQICWGGRAVKYTTL